MVRQKEKVSSRKKHALGYGIISLVIAVWTIVDIIRTIAIVCSNQSCNGSDTIYWTVFGSIKEFNWFWWIVFMIFVKSIPLAVRSYFFYALMKYWKVSDEELMS